MDWNRTKLLAPWVASLGFGLMGCGAQAPQSPIDPVGSRPVPAALDLNNVRIENDPAVLESRMTRGAVPLTVAPKGVSGVQVAAKSADERVIGVRLTQVATVAAPTVDGHVVQANDIEISGNTALVAYNFAGDVFAGAVQAIDFSHPEHPVLVSEVLYRHADVNAVTLQGSDVFIGLASDDATLSTPALVERLKLTGGSGLSQTGQWVDLPSWAVTDLAVHGDDVAAGVGAQNGGVALLRRNDLTLQRFAAAFDVRGVAMASNDDHKTADDGVGVMSVCGQPGMMLQHGLPALTVAAGTPVVGYGVDAAKGTIEYAGHLCYLGAGDGGFQVRNPGGSLLAQLGNGEFGNHAPATAVTNAVSVANHLAFVAAGPAGVQVVRLGRYRCDGRESEETAGLRLLGQLALEDGASGNMVKAKNDLLVVAAGSGGVKLVTMQFLQ